MAKTFKEELVQRIVRNFLDVYILRLIRSEPLWGYKIIKRMNRLFGMKVRHGALYPLLNTLEENGFLRSTRQTQKGRVRRVYKITSRGMQLVESYYDSLREQLQESDLKGRSAKKSA